MSFSLRIVSLPSVSSVSFKACDSITNVPETQTLDYLSPGSSLPQPAQVNPGAPVVWQSSSQVTCTCRRWSQRGSSGPSPPARPWRRPPRVETPEPRASWTQGGSWWSDWSPRSSGSTGEVWVTSRRPAGTAPPWWRRPNGLACSSPGRSRCSSRRKHRQRSHKAPRPATAASGPDLLRPPEAWRPPSGPWTCSAWTWRRGSPGCGCWSKHATAPPTPRPSWWHHCGTPATPSTGWGPAPWRSGSSRWSPARGRRAGWCERGRPYGRSYKRSSGGRGSPDPAHFGCHQEVKAKWRLSPLHILQEIWSCSSLLLLLSWCSAVTTVTWETHTHLPLRHTHTHTHTHTQVLMRERCGSLG